MSAMIACAPILFLLGAVGEETPGSWRQFRGPGGAALAVGNNVLPTEIGPKQYVVWKTPLPAGHSSPVIDADRIFLTGVADGKLFTIDRRAIVVSAGLDAIGLQHFARWGAGADPGDIISVPPFDEMLKKYDANKNGILHGFR